MGSKYVITLLLCLQLGYVFSQNVGIGEPNPGSKLSVKGSMAVGDNYSSLSAPEGSLIVEKKLGIGTSSIDSNAILDIQSTTKGIILPRMSKQQRESIAHPAQGLMVFDTDSNTLFFNDGANWFNFPAVDLIHDKIVGLTSSALTNSLGLNLGGGGGLLGGGGSSGGLGNGTAAGNTPYWNGSSWVVNSSNIYNRGGNVGIGTSSPSTTFEVNGNGRFTGSLRVGAYTLPTSDGNNGQVLTTNGSGTITWATVSGASGNYINNSTSQQSSANFNIGGNGSMGGNASIGGSATIGGNTGIGGSATIGGNATISGNNTVGGSLSVGGNVSITGTLSLNHYSFPGSNGTNGQVLTTNGAGATSWQTISTGGGGSPTAYQQNQSQEITVKNSSFSALSGLTKTITLSSPAKVYLRTDGGIQTTSNSSSGYSTVDIVLTMNGNILADGGYKRISALNNAGLKGQMANWSMATYASSTSGQYDLPAGTYTFQVEARKVAGSNATVGGDNSSVLEGVLQVIIYQ